MKIYLKSNGEWKLFEGDAAVKQLATNNIIIGARAIIGEGARIGARAIIGEWARIGARARIGEEASIEHTIDCIVMGPLGSENRMLTFYRGPQSLRAATGCFDGNLESFVTAVKSKHGDSACGKDYLAAVEYARVKFSLNNK